MPERWRTAWNPNSFKFETPIRKGVKTPIRIEWQLDEDERMEAQGLAEYDLPEVGVNLYFRDGKLDTIQLGPEYDDDDNIVWPERILE